MSIFKDVVDAEHFGAFITGSHAYGTPHADSDIDVVIYLPDAHDFDFLTGELGSSLKEDLDGTPASYGCAVRSGKLNLIICQHPEDYFTWKQGTEDLRKIRPVTRAQAMAHFDKLRGRA